jgi:hypothetical protein
VTPPVRRSALITCPSKWWASSPNAPAGAEGSDDDVIVMPFTTFRERLFPQRNAKGEILVGIIIIQAIDPISD